MCGGICGGMCVDMKAFAAYGRDPSVSFCHGFVSCGRCVAQSVNEGAKVALDFLGRRGVDMY